MTSATVTDSDVSIRNDVMRQLHSHSLGHVFDGVQAVVHNGFVALTGRVNWLSEKGDAENTVRQIRDVRRVFNRIAVEPPSVARDVHQRILDAFNREDKLEVSHISVAVTGPDVVLIGHVATESQRDCAGRAAAAAPGIGRVDNRIVVQRIIAPIRCSSTNSRRRNARKRLPV